MPNWYPDSQYAPGNPYAYMSYADRIRRIVARLYKGSYVSYYTISEKLRQLARRLSGNPQQTIAAVEAALGDTRFGLLNGVCVNWALHNQLRKVSVTAKLTPAKVERAHGICLEIVEMLSPLCAHPDYYVTNSWFTRLKLSPDQISDAGKALIRDLIWRLYAKCIPDNRIPWSIEAAHRHLNRLMPTFREWNAVMFLLEKKSPINNEGEIAMAKNLTTGEFREKLLDCFELAMLGKLSSDQIKGVIGTSNQINASLSAEIKLRALELKAGSSVGELGEVKLGKPKRQRKA